MENDPSLSPIETHSAAVLIPIKAFINAKVRLANILDTNQRQALAKRMAMQVISAAGALGVYVVCDNEEVKEWSMLQGAEVIFTPGLGLNGAVEHGVKALCAQGIKRVIVSHADLPLAKDLPTLVASQQNSITLVPDRIKDGTNVVVIPSDIGFRFSYGPGSFLAHCKEVKRLGCALVVKEDPSLTLDVDLPSDLAHIPTTWMD